MLCRVVLCRVVLFHTTLASRLLRLKPGFSVTTLSALGLTAVLTPICMYVFALPHESGISLHMAYILLLVNLGVAGVRSNLI